MWLPGFKRIDPLHTIAGCKSWLSGSKTEKYLQKQSSETAERLLKGYKNLNQSFNQSIVQSHQSACTLI